MSNCNNCFNGCTETISDQCIRYTGIDIPNLGIKTGDSLSFVEQVLLTSLLSTLDGRGISIDLSNINICNLVQNYLPAQPPSEGFTLNDILSALIQASCSTQTQLISNYNSINALINTQSTTFADANGAMASLITNISATMDADRNHTAALITTETLARVTANTAMASLITNLSATVDNDRSNTAALIRTEALTRADTISALASRIDTITASGVDLGFLDSKIDAAIVIERTASANPVQALASSLTSLTATVNGHTSSITTNESAIATVNGHLTASYGLAVDANGHIASMNLLSNGTSSARAFTADSFKIFNGTSSIAPFTVVDGNVVMTGTTVVDTIVTSGTGPAIGATGWNGLSLNRSSDNLLKFRHPNGVVGMEMGIISGKLVLNWYNDSGVKIWQGGSDGVTAVENSAAAYAGQITNILRIDVGATGIVSYEGDILDISYSPRVGATPSSWGIYGIIPGSSGFNSMIEVGLKNPNPNNKFKIILSTTDGLYGNANAIPAVANKGATANTIYILDGLSSTTTITRSIYIEIQTTKY